MIKAVEIGGNELIYFTADTHFGHANILRFCDRPFASVQEMDATMIRKWNAKVHNNDTVFILGDMFFRSTNVEEVLGQLKGKKRLIVGNHDTFWMRKVSLEKYFESVDSLLEISDGQHGLTLCHYPMLSWNHQRRTYMIHGHIHNDTTMDFWPLIAARERVLNAGADINRFEPVSFDELLANNLRFKQEWAGENRE